MDIEIKKVKYSRSIPAMKSPHYTEFQMVIIIYVLVQGERQW